ncbi:hypothetical protein EV182_005781 [Spiromyces aspiralis]|uniref:Uncharacterized protein n=1 Tax=Spiromyces aspiralis TaxID=68401 RepID=A0ACC1H9I6_9FUNG|nr:hypothetical protein EV182_005781 [Spiromyces aspiralis]
MGAGASKAARRYPRGADVSRSAAEEVRSSQRITEERDAEFAKNEKDEQVKNEQFMQNLNFLVRPKETLVYTTSSNPQTNRSVQTLMHRKWEDDVETRDLDRVSAESVTRLLRETLQGLGDDTTRIESLSAKYQLSPHIAQSLVKYLRATPPPPPPKS